jgi:tetratricopeptide (TPR) repeat protein
MQRLSGRRVLAAFAAAVFATAFAAGAAQARDKAWSATMSKAEVARDLGDFKKARGFFEQALADNPSGFPGVIANSQLADTLLQLGEAAKARDAAKKALDGFKNPAQLPQLHGQILEILAAAMQAAGGDKVETDKAEIDKAIAKARAIREAREDPFVPHAEEYVLTHAPTGIRFPAMAGTFHRVQLKPGEKGSAYIVAKYSTWLGDSAVLAGIVLLPAGDETLRSRYDRIRGVTRHRYKDAKRLARGDYAVAKSLGHKGLTVQWIVTDAGKKLWQANYLIERGKWIMQINVRTLAHHAERAAGLIDDMVRAFK